MNTKYEESLLEHLSRHNIKKWLLDGAKIEDAQTIGAAVKSIPDDRLARRLARALAEYHPDAQ